MSDDSKTGDEPQLMMLDRGLAFYGAITASVSHELNNVVSIIDQTTGLLEDMIAAVERGKPISTDRLEEIAGSLRKQTERGLGIIKRLNAFSHSSDTPRRQYDLLEAIANLVELSRRLADMKRVDLELHPGEAVPEVSGNPFFARQVIFEPVRLALSNARAGDRIDIRLGTCDSDVEVRVELAPHALKREQLATPFFGELLGHADAKVTFEEHDDRMSCRFLFACGKREPE